MKYIAYFFQILFSDLFLVLRLFCGNRIGFNFISLVSPFSTIKTKKGVVKMGKMTAVRANTEVCANGGEICIGQRCFVNKNCMIVAHNKITIGDGTTIGPNVCIYDHDHNYKKEGQSDFISKPVSIGKNVWIGAGSIILKGTVIGDNCVVGAGTVVNGIIDARSIVCSERHISVRGY
jgi:acetyltransferase-like isoleucine patch superfamily enzyme